MQRIMRLTLCILICIWWLAGIFPASAEIQKLKAGTVRTFARSVPIATVWIDPAMLSLERMQMEQKPDGNVVFLVDSEGTVRAEHVRVREGETTLGSLKLTFPEAAVLTDGSRVDFHVNFTQITVVGKKDNGEYLDSLMICSIGKLPGETIRLSPLSMKQKKHIGILYDLELVAETETEEGFLFTANGINKRRVSRDQDEFSELIDAQANTCYSEAAVIEEGALLSRLCFPKTSPLVVQGNRFTASNTVMEERYDTGFVFLGKSNGTKIRFISSAGTNTEPLKMYIMPGEISHLVSIAAEKGGQISLRADGRTYPAGAQGAKRCYDVPNGKRVTCIIEPDIAYTIDRVMFNGREIRLFEQPGYSVNGKKSMFFLEVESFEDLVITVTWERNGQVTRDDLVRNTRIQ